MKYGPINSGLRLTYICRIVTPARRDLRHIQKLESIMGMGENWATPNMANVKPAGVYWSLDMKTLLEPNWAFNADTYPKWSNPAVEQNPQILLVTSSLRTWYSAMCWSEIPVIGQWNNPMCGMINDNPIYNILYMGLSENSVPLHPMVNDHYPY